MANSRLRFLKNSVGASDWIGPQSGDPSPIVYLSAVGISTDGKKGWSEPIFNKATGSRFRCFSFAYTGSDSPMFSAEASKALDWCLENNVRVFLDSGAHSFHKILYYGSHLKGANRMERVKKVDEMVTLFSMNFAKYVRRCFKTDRLFDFYVTLDFAKDCPVIYAMTERLVSLGIRPVPVYHGDSSLDWVRKYIDLGHKLIGVGRHSIGKNTQDGTHRYYSKVLDFCGKHGVVCHGFAITGASMFELPWYSCDSTSYIKSAAYGRIFIIRPDKQRIGTVHISSRYAEASGYGALEALAKEPYRYLRDLVEARGFDLEELRRNRNQRILYNAKVIIEASEKRASSKYKSWECVF